MKRNVMTRPDLKRSRELLEAACRESKRHNLLAADALRVYGDHGSPIPGAVRDHFPDIVKDYLRASARLITELGEEAFKQMPKRVHVATFRALSKAVVAKVGGGFYWPQP